MEEFVSEHPAIKESDEQTEVLTNLFSAIATLAEGTSVAGTYFDRGVEQRYVELTFPKVFFDPVGSR